MRKLASKIFGHQHIIIHERVTYNSPIINVSNAILYLAIQSWFARQVSGAARDLMANSQNIRLLRDISPLHVIYRHTHTHTVIL